MTRIGVALAAGGLALAAGGLPSRAAEPVMVQCGRAYQAAKTAGTLNGADWNSFRTACAARLKSSEAAPADAPRAEAASQAAPAAPPAPAPAATPASAAAASGGMAAMHARQKQCGAEWRADKAALVAKAPGLTWPKYWSQCNARLKGSGG